MPQSRRYEIGAEIVPNSVRTPSLSHRKDGTSFAHYTPTVAARLNVHLHLHMHVYVAHKIVNYTVQNQA
jgi:hypothetical protein